MIKLFKIILFVQYHEKSINKMYIASPLWIWFWVWNYFVGYTFDITQLNHVRDWWRLVALQWRHNEHDGVSNHRSHNCFLNLLFRRRSKKTSKLRVTGLGEGNSPVTGEFPTERASNAENVSIDDDIMEPRQQYPSDLLSGVIYAGQQKSRVLWPHDDVIKWKLFLRYRPVVRAIHQLPRLRRMRDVTMKVSLVLSLNIFYRIYDRYKVVWWCYNRDRWRLVQGCCRNSRPTITNPLTIVPPTPEMIITK